MWRSKSGSGVGKTLCFVLERASLPLPSLICTICAVGGKRKIKNDNFKKTDRNQLIVKERVGVEVGVG